MKLSINGVASTSGTQSGDSVHIEPASVVTVEVVTAEVAGAEHHPERPSVFPSVVAHRFKADAGAAATFDEAGLTIASVTPTSGLESDAVVALDGGSQVVVTVHEQPAGDGAPQVRELRFKAAADSTFKVV